MRRLGTTILAISATGLAAGLAAAAIGKSRADAAEASWVARATQTSVTSCSGADRAYRIVRGTYRGTSTGAPALTGIVQLRTKTVVSLDTGRGWTAGTLTVRSPAGKLKATTKLIAVNTETGRLNGFLLGRTLRPGAKLLANFSATLAADWRMLTGSLGGGDSATRTAVAYRGGCVQALPHGKSKGKGKK
jgi:hypothetical protein